MTIHSLLRLIAASSLLLMLGSVPSFAQDTAFTYQGRLYDGANAAEGSYDLRFTTRWPGRARWA